MKKTDLELMNAVIAAMEFANTAWSISADEVAAQDLMEKLSMLGYKIVKDDAE